MKRRTFLLGPAPFLAACASKPGTSFRGHVFVATEESRAIAVVDLAAFTLVRRIELAAPATSLLLGSALYALCPSTSTLLEVDPVRWTIGRTARLDGTPIAWRLKRQTLWCLQKGRAALLGFSPADFRQQVQIALPRDPVAFDVHQNTAAVTLADGAVVTVDLTTRRVSAGGPLSDELGAVLVRGDGQVMLIADRAARQLILLDPATRRVIVRLALAIRPDHLCFKADGGQLFLTGEGRDAVVITYPYRAEVAQTHLSGRAPGEMAVSTGPDYLFVSNPAAGSVTIFDIDTQRVLAVTGVGSQPGPIVVTPDQQYALVLNTGSGDMAVIRTAAITRGRAKQAPLFTMIPVGARPVSAVVRRAG